MSSRKEQIIQYFEQEAKEFDLLIQQLIPYYNQMIEALILSIPFKTQDKFSVIDLGCGTGTVAHAIQQDYPKANITCMDQSPSMLQLAHQKLKGVVNCIEGDFSSFSFEQSYDVVVSSLALHHLEDQTEHINFYQKIYESLTKKGVFITIDVVQASYTELQAVYMQQWIAFMNQQISMTEIKQRWLKNHFEEDRRNR